MIKLTRLVLVALLLAPLASLYAGELKLASLFTDHMVLQRELPVPVWGWADAGAKVTVEFGNQKKTATAGDDGKWRVMLDALPASSESRALRISTTNNQQPITITDVLVGDVWLCSGQSNMGMGVGGSANAEEEIANARYPEIRLFTVAQNPTLSPTNAVNGEWEPCSTQTVGKFSAAAYFFGRELHKELKIPIGLLHSSVGGTPAEAWTRLEALKTIPALAERAEKEISQIKSQEDDNKRFVTDRVAWEKKYGVEPPPIAEAARSWADPELKTDDWSPITLPNQWAQLGAKSGGVFWVRRDVTLPESAAGKPFGLGLNWVSEQYDTAFFNGVEVGHASDKAPDFYNQQRRYNVPGKLVKAGRNVIAVRIVSATERAGMWQWGHMLGLPVADQTAVDNKWLMKTESTFPALPPEALKSRPKPNNIPFRSVSAALYNGMIAPLVPFAIKGAIWYQGESNASRHGEYGQLLSLMIRDWRDQWGRSFPFIIQQLVNNGAPPKDANQPGSWPYLRQAQEQVAGSVPDCGIASGMELGDAFTIHPKNKQEVGRRLALVALEKTYAKKIESSGPRFASMKIEGASIRVKFTHAKGLQAKGGLLKRFAIAGADQKFVWADASIHGETVVVSSPQVSQPVAVRYAWADNPDGCNLFNGAGLSAFPFEAIAASTTYNNPIIAGDYADPTILRVGDDYYMTHSPFRYAPGFLIWRSRDLVHWTPVTRALQQYDGDVWAADLVQHKGLFYIYYRSTKGNRVITATHIEGPWSKPVDLKIGEIDPGHVVGPDGKRYLHMSGGMAVELADDGLSVTGKLKKVYDGWPIPADWSVECPCLEGPKLLFRDGWYHLFSAQGGTAGPATSHMMVEARSRSPLGPWENSPYNPVIHTASMAERWWSCGHGTVFETTAGQWWVMFHGYQSDMLSLGRQTLMAPIEWTQDGWARLPAGFDAAAPIAVPNLAAAPLPPLERSDDFAGPTLGLQWQFWDEFDPSRFSFGDKSLVMKGKGTSPADCGPMTCMAGDASYTLEVDVEIKGDAQAGLILFYNSSWFTGVGLATDGIWAGERGKLGKTKLPATGRRMVIRLVNNHNNLDFLAGPERNLLRKVCCSINVSGYTHHTFGGFLALRPALYCAGKGQAVFRNFRYTPIR